MAVVEKPLDSKIKLVAANEYQEYDPKKVVSCWVDIKLEAPIFEEEDSKRVPVDLVAVIDRSGSMGGNKLELVKKTLHFVVSQLTERDRLALIVYDDTVDVIFSLTAVSSANKSKIEGNIDSVHTRGGTNLCGGLIKGMQMVMEREGDKADVTSVLLLTDGLANVGISSQDGILNAMKSPFDFKEEDSSEDMNPFMMQMSNANANISNTNFLNQVQYQQAPQMPQVQMQQPQMPQQQIQPPPQPPSPPHVQQIQQAPPPPPLPPVIQPTQPSTGASPKEPADTPHSNFQGTVYTFGFGSDHNASLLEEISNQGNGAYYFIDSQEKVPESFASCLGGLLSTVGQNMSLSVKLENGSKIKEFSAKNNPKYKKDNTEAEVALGDLQSEETRDILIELTLPVCETGSIKYCSVALSYFNVITATMETEKLELMVERSDTGKPKVSNPIIDRERNRIQTTAAIKEARQKASEGKYEEGRKILTACQEKVKASATAEDELSKGMLIDIADCLRGMESEESFQGYGVQRMANISQNYQNQRANFVPDVQMQQQVMYQTKAKSAMMKKF